MDERNLSVPSLQCPPQLLPGRLWPQRKMQQIVNPLRANQESALDRRFVLACLLNPSAKPIKNTRCEKGVYPTAWIERRKLSRKLRNIQFADIIWSVQVDVTHFQIELRPQLGRPLSQGITDAQDLVSIEPPHGIGGVIK